MHARKCCRFDAPVHHACVSHGSSQDLTQKLVVVPVQRDTFSMFTPYCMDSFESELLSRKNVKAASNWLRRRNFLEKRLVHMHFEVAKCGYDCAHDIFFNVQDCVEDALCELSEFCACTDSIYVGRTYNPKQRWENGHSNKFDFMIVLMLGWVDDIMRAENRFILESRLITPRVANRTEHSVGKVLHDAQFLYVCVKGRGAEGYMELLRKRPDDEHFNGQLDSDFVLS